MDSEGKTKFESILEEIESEVPYKRAKAEEPKEIVVQTPEGETKKVVPANKWEAPPGWKPPGWMSDEENMKNAQSFMGWQAGGPRGAK